MTAARSRQRWRAQKPAYSPAGPFDSGQLEHQFAPRRLDPEFLIVGSQFRERSPTCGISLAPPSHRSPEPFELWVVAPAAAGQNGLGMLPLAVARELARLKSMFVLLPDPRHLKWENEAGMTAAEIGEFQARDWRLIERAKSDYWVRQKAAMPPAAVLEIASGLYEYARSLRPDWPNAAEREADLASHVRSTAMLRRAGENPEGGK